MKTVRMKDLMHRLKEKHPGVSEKILSQVIRQGFHNMSQIMKDKEEIFIESGRKGIRFIVYNYRSYSQVKKENAEKG